MQTYIGTMHVCAWRRETWVHMTVIVCGRASMVLIYDNTSEFSYHSCWTYIYPYSPVKGKTLVHMIHVVERHRGDRPLSKAIMTHAMHHKGPILLWINFSPSMDKWSHTQWCIGWNYLSVPNFNGMDIWCFPTFPKIRNYLSMSF